MKKTINTPDKEIKLSQGDKIEIYVNRKDVDFHFSCDGTGNVFTLTKKELKELLE